MGVVEDPDALQEAATMERECYTSIKNSFQEMQKVVEARSSSERSIVNEKTVFEIAYDKVMMKQHAPHFLSIKREDLIRSKAISLYT